MLTSSITPLAIENKSSAYLDYHTGSLRILSAFRYNANKRFDSHCPHSSHYFHVGKMKQAERVELECSLPNLCYFAMQTFKRC